jgi:hypothetical protein
MLISQREVWYGTVPPMILKGNRGLNVITLLCPAEATSEPSDGPNAQTAAGPPPRQRPIAGGTYSTGGLMGYLEF